MTPPSTSSLDQPASGAGPAKGFVLSPAARLLWRTAESVHLELGDRSVVVDGLPASAIDQVAPGRPVAGDRPALDPSVRTAFDVLTEDGFLWPRSAGDEVRHTPPVPRLAGQLTALAARHGEDAAELLHARRHYAVVVTGNTAATVHLAALLAAAGVGRVRCAVDGTVRLLHAVPGGVEPADEGDDLQVAGVQAVLRAAPEADVTPLPSDDVPDLTVLAQAGPVDDDRRSALHATGSAHLRFAVGVDHAVVGPLVLPGLTSCLRCADLHRLDRDPAWSVLSAQLAVPRRYGPTADAVVSTLAVGVAAMQVLTFLDGGDPAGIDGTLEIHPPDWRVRRRSWTPHPGCDCGLAPADTSSRGLRWAE
ncbi:thiamine biosynthesis protein ThiF [uncultured Jatrophihabitans sp.]|uniref:thiamine biosynthesis protein ThiF n=1 Tax=uncultured Jatrophihabitans sp. TaxID=1610747 RepID=UPI0035CB44CE